MDLTEGLLTGLGEILYISNHLSETFIRPQPPNNFRDYIFDYRQRCLLKIALVLNGL